MKRRTEPHVRKIKQTLETGAARPAGERALAGETSQVVSGRDRGRSTPDRRAVPGPTPNTVKTFGGSTTKDTTGQIGTPGNLNVFGFLTGEDYNPDLDGFPMFANYNKMRLGDAQVNATLLMLKLPLKGARWIVKPGSEDAQDQAIADFVQANLIDDDALARSWQHVLDNAMLKFDFGCSAEEVVWTVRDETAATGTDLSRPAGLVELGKRKDWALDQAVKNGSVVYSTVSDLAPRLPRTFYRWIEDPKTGAFAGPNAFLQQFAPKNGQYGFWNIPADQLALHIRAREGNNYYGRSVLRTAYPHWWWKAQLYRIDMVGHDRFHVGIPRAALDEHYNAATAPLNKIEETLKGLRSHDRAYMVQPYGVTYDVYAAPTGGRGTSAILLSIEHHNMMIARNILQSFSAQGEQRHGSFGAAKVTSEVYFDALQGEADEIGSELKQCVVKRLCDQNFDMRGRKYPTIVCTDLRAVDFTQLSEAFAALSNAKIVTPDDDLEGFFRDLADAPVLPEHLKGQDRAKVVAAPAVPPAPGDPPAVPSKPAPNTPAVEASKGFQERGRTFGRTPSALERRIFDLHGVPSELEQQQALLVRALAEIRLAQLDTVAARIAKKDGRPTAAFTDIRHAHITMPKMAELRKAIRVSQDRVFAYGQKTVRDELRRQQGRGATALIEDPTAAKNKSTAISHLVSSAQVTAKKEAEAWRARILEEGLRQRRSGLQGTALADAIVEHLRDEAESGARRDAAAEVHEAFGLGRANAANTLADDIERCVYSAILDKATCEPCASLDQEEFVYGSEAYFAALPPNPNCAGLDNCRCVMLYLISGAQP